MVFMVWTLVFGRVAGARAEIEKIGGSDLTNLQSVNGRQTIYGHAMSCLRIRDCGCC